MFVGLLVWLILLGLTRRCRRLKAVTWTSPPLPCAGSCMPRCQTCQTENPPENTVCSSCQTPLATPPPEPEPEPESEQPRPARKRRRQVDPEAAEDPQTKAYNLRFKRVVHL